MANGKRVIGHEPSAIRSLWLDFMAKGKGQRFGSRGTAYVTLVSYGDELVRARNTPV